MEGRFSGRAGIVTGAGSGIGRAVSLKLAEQGGDVFAVDLNEDAAAETAKAAEQQGLPGTVVPFGADVTDSSQVADYVQAATARWDNLSFFHNNAGVDGPHKSIAELSEEEWDFVLNINLRSNFIGIKHVSPVLRKAGGGAIVNTGSVLSLKAAANRVDYTVTKHGIIGLTKTAAAELAADGIKVNAIAPGPVETPLMAKSELLDSPDDPGIKRRKLEAAIPVGRYGSPEEIAETVAFLLHPEPAYLTAAVVVIDGGLTAV